MVYELATQGLYKNLLGDMEGGKLKMENMNYDTGRPTGLMQNCSKNLLKMISGA